MNNFDRTLDPQSSEAKHQELKDFVSSGLNQLQAAVLDGTNAQMLEFRFLRVGLWTVLRHCS